MTTPDVSTPVLRAVHVQRSQEDTFRLFTEQIGTWWPLASFGVFGLGASVAFEVDRLVERSAAGESAVWAEVLEWEPPRHLVLRWHPGEDDSKATLVQVDFLADDDGTRVELTHRDWEVYGADAERIRSSYGEGWPQVLGAFEAASGR
jgi:uncharacterized protein YndB with AHSA1/START domain